MVRIAAFPKCWIDDISAGRMDLFEWIELSATLECDGIEMYSRFLQSYESDYLSRVRRRVESLGMEIPMMCYSPDFTIPDQSARAAEVEKQIEMTRVTAELGGKYCRTLSGQHRPEVDIDQGVAWVVECIENSLKGAARWDVDLVIENHYKDGFWKYREFAQKRDVFLSIVNRISSARFGVQYDPSNAVVAGDDYLSLLKSVLPKVKTIHASDRYLLPGTDLDSLREADGTLGYPENLIHGVTGQGLIDYETIFSRLADSGFDGWLSIEDGMAGMGEMRESIGFLKRMRDRYFPTPRPI